MTHPGLFTVPGMGPTAAAPRSLRNQSRRDGITGELRELMLLDYGETHDRAPWAGRPSAGQGHSVVARTGWATRPACAAVPWVGPPREAGHDFCWVAPLRSDGVKVTESDGAVSPSPPSG